MKFVELADKQTPAGPRQFAVSRVPSFPNHFVGRDEGGRPVVLIHSVDLAVLPAVRLTGLEVQFCVPCDVEIDGSVLSETLSVLRCLDATTDVQRHFLNVAESLIGVLGNNPAIELVATSVQRLIEIFQRLASAPTTDVIGVFGELLVAVSASNPATAIAAWRNLTYEHFDFGSADARLEVKATASGVRKHSLSDRQVNPPEGTIGILASVFVEEMAGGQSLQELAEEVMSAVAAQPNFVLKVQEVLASTLGASLTASLERRFDRAEADRTLKYYDLRSVPAIRPPLPPHVSQVRFMSDLSNTPELTQTQIGQFASAVRELLR